MNIKGDKMKIKLTCPICEDTFVGDSKYIYVCEDCNCEMKRELINDKENE